MPPSLTVIQLITMLHCCLSQAFRLSPSFLHMSFGLFFLFNELFSLNLYFVVIAFRRSHGTWPCRKFCCSLFCSQMLPRGHNDEFVLLLALAIYRISTISFINSTQYFWLCRVYSCPSRHYDLVLQGTKKQDLYSMSAQIVRFGSHLYSQLLLDYI